MRSLSLALLLILGLICFTTTAHAQGLEHWQTAGAGLSTPMGFNVGGSYSVVVKKNLFFQASGSFTSDPYVTRHSVFAAGPAVGLRQYTDVALLSVSAGPMYSRGVRGADQILPGTSYDTVSMNVIGQVLFRELNMGVELYTNMNPVRNVSGMRLIYRLGNLR